MAAISSFRRVYDRGTNSRRSEVECDWHVVTDDLRGSVIQLHTFGSADRQSPRKSSQNFELDQKMAGELIDILIEVFPGIASTATPRPGSAQDESSAPASDQMELGGVVPQDLYVDLARAVEDSGLFFPLGGNLVRSFMCSLLAKPFTILTGLSGSGKTQLAMRLGEWFGTSDSGSPRHLVVAVRPDWTGPEAFFGYQDAIRSAEIGKAAWHVPDAFEFVLQARAHPAHPYVLILDEMNLAHVERYFSDFLSGLESRRPLLPPVARDDAAGGWVVVPGAEKAPLPQNLFVVGTVNVDETTYMFSPKVLDRASTFEFRVDAALLDPDRGRPRPAAAAKDPFQRAFRALAANDEWHLVNPHPQQAEIVEVLREIHGTLAVADLEFGHRTMYESLRFASFYAASGDPDLDHALDLLMMQKFLPKVHGSRRRLEPTLLALHAFAVGSASEAPRLPISARKLARMLDSVRANQFVSFAE